MPMIVWIGIAVAGLLLVAGVVVTLTTQRSLVDERLEQYLEGDQEREEEVVEAAQSAGLLTGWITSQVDRTTIGERISRELARADLKLKTGEYVAVTGMASLLTGVIGYFFAGGSLLFAIVGLVFGSFLPRFYVNYQQAARLRKFDDQLSDMLNLMVNGLRTGFSSMQAMEAVSKELPSPISDEFKRVVREMQLGVSMEQALENLHRRIPSEDLDLAITAINVQREVGGNLAEILDTISHTIRERVRIKGEVRAITAQVAYSGRFLSLMPIVLAMALWALNRDYMGAFFEEPRICGYAMLSLAGVLLVVGYVTLNKIGDIEI